MFKQSNDIFCCPIIRTEGIENCYSSLLECYGYCECQHCCIDSGCCDRSNFFFGCAMFCFAVSSFVGLILISYYVGPLLAFSALPQCYRYNNTFVSYNLGKPKQCLVKTINGFVAVGASYSSGVNGTSIAIPGSQSDCQTCQDMGIGVLFVILSVIIFLVWIGVLITFRIVRRYREAEKVVLKQKKDFMEDFDRSAVSVSDNISAEGLDAISMSE